MAKIPSTRSARPSRSYDVIADGDYDARIVRFVGVGVQDQPAYEGVAKDPAFKCFIQFELIDVNATGVDSEGKALEPSPACQFKDYFLFPGAKRGNVFNLCQAIDPSIQAVPSDLTWFTETMLGKVVNVKVGHYVGKDGKARNKVVAVTPIPTKYQAGVGQARCEMVGFDPYEETEAMKVAYAKLPKFQRDVLAEAKDAQHMPFAGTEPMKLESNKAPSTPTSSNPYASRQEPQRQAAPASNYVDEGFDDEVPF